MKTRTRAVVILIASLLLAGAWSSPAGAAVSFDFFYSNLSPHGTWQVSAQHGRVWRPSVYTTDWNPYYDGHWVYADVGWTWVSDYSWGAIPYHYGTWVYDPLIGWVWVPGYVWAPAWVVFRTGPDYIGWAPVSPGYTVGVSLSIGARPASSFIFVSSRDFLARRVRTCVVPEYRTRTIFKSTKVVNTLVVERNVVVNRGLDVRSIERASGRRIEAVPIEKVRRAGPGRRVTREQIAVDSRRGRRALRVSERIEAPVSSPARRERIDAPAPPPERREREVRERTRPERRVAEPHNGRPDAPKSKVTAPARTKAQEPPSRAQRPVRNKPKPHRPPDREKDHDHP